MKFNPYSSAPSAYRFIENNYLDFYDVAGLRVEYLKRYNEISEIWASRYSVKIGSIFP